MATKKVKSTGRFGTRYGLRIRRELLEVDKLMRARHVCHDCAKAKVKRVAAGVWECRKCGLTFSGGAYAPITVAAKIMRGEVKPLEVITAPEKTEVKVEAAAEEVKEAEAKEEKPKRKTRAKKAKAEKPEKKAEE